MGRLFGQVAAIASMNIRSIPQRLWMSLSTVVAIALVVAVLLAFLAMGNGFRQAQSSAGAADIAILLRDGAQTEINSGVSREQRDIVEEAPGIAREDGRPLVSAELYVIVDGISRSSGLRANLPLRGLPLVGVALRHNVRIAEGRMFRPGTNEIVAGRSVVREFAGFDLGKSLRLGQSVWTIVGIFEDGGTVRESELWGDVGVVQSVFKRENFFQTIRARLAGPQALAPLKAYVDADPRLKLAVESESEFFAAQAKQSSDLIQKLGWPLAIIMAIGALAGALNTMYSSVASRGTEIATLRAIGFGRIPTFVGTLAEALALATLGGIVGVVAATLLFQGFTASTLSANFTQVVFTFRVTPALCVNALVLALVVGFLGGMFPAFRAARLPIVGMLGEQ
ncbi:MAG: ABC transporter permease [Proteobacteria bacterium]|nr:ABC transporter permease [Pseudomonadota bacterium]